MQYLASQLACDRLETGTVYAVRRNDLQPEIEAFGDRRCAPQKRRRIEVRIDERGGRGVATRLHDRKREVVDGAQQQFAQHIERRLLEGPVERAFDVLLVDDLARAHAALKKAGRNVERDDLVGPLQKR